MGYFLTFSLQDIDRDYYLEVDSNKEFCYRFKTSMEHVTDYLKHLKIFLTPLIIVFVVVSLQFMGVHAPNVIQPIQEKINAVLHISPSTQTDVVKGGVVYD